MSLTTEEVKKIAYLARLSIEDEHISQYSDDLSRIFDLVEQMNAADTDGIEPMSHPLDAIQRLREDIVTESNDPSVRDKYLKLAPATEKGLFLVPKVIE